MAIIGKSFIDSSASIGKKKLQAPKPKSYLRFERTEDGRCTITVSKAGDGQARRYVIGWHDCKRLADWINNSH